MDFGVPPISFDKHLQVEFLSSLMEKRFSSKTEMKKLKLPNRKQNFFPAAASQLTSTSTSSRERFQDLDELKANKTFRISIKTDAS